MKSILKFVVYILLIELAFVSCSKNRPGNTTSNIYPPSPQQSPPQSSSGSQPLLPFPPVNDSLSGKEFLFTNLIWETWGDRMLK